MTVVRRAGSDERGQNDANNERTVVVEEVATGATQQHELLRMNGRAVGIERLKKIERERVKPGERPMRIEGN